MWRFCFPLPCESSGSRSGRNAFLFAEAAQHRFPRFGFQLFGILHVDKHFCTDGLHVRQIGFLAIEPLDRSSM